MCEAEPTTIDLTGILAPIQMYRGDTWTMTETLTLPDGVTVSSASFVVMDENGDAVTGLTETADVSGLNVEWGLETSAETAALDPETEYSYRLGVTLSNGIIQTIYRGPFKVL